MKRTFLILVSLVLLVANAWAMDSFVVRDIKVKGLQRLTVGTVLNYVPVQVGDRLDDKNTPQIIRSLYNTGFFDDVDLQRDGKALVIVVTERPTIGSMKVKGNDDISDDKLDVVLREMNLVEGRIFDRSALERIKQSLQTEYNNRGKYNATIETTVESQARNRVSVRIDIDEGDVAKIKEINIIGNNTFKTKRLLKQFKLTTSDYTTFVTHKDRYDKQRLDASLEALRSFYMDRGFVKFDIDSTQVSLTPDRKHVFITVKVSEGPRYTIKNFDVAGKLILSRDKIKGLVNVKPGDIFSRAALSGSAGEISKELANHGYAFAKVTPQPQINEDDKSVLITFMIEPGKRVYVRHISYIGNVKTQDHVLRRAMRQDEGGLLSLNNIRESERQLRLLGYLEDVRIATRPVTGTEDQVDIDFNLTEAPSATAIAAVGYGTDGFLVNASFNQANFLGTGKTVGLNFETSLSGRSYHFKYFNPFFTETGIGLGYNLYYQTTTPGKLDKARYTTDQMGLSSNLSIPLSDRNSLQLGAGIQNLELTSFGAPKSTQFTNFTNVYGSEFLQFKMNAGWTRNSLDRAIFPTKGWMNQVMLEAALPLNKDSLSFYKATYFVHYYQPMLWSTIFHASASLGYGAGILSGDELPFYENYFAGGLVSNAPVRGYRSYSLGPKDSNGEPLGGNILTSGTVGLIIPTPFPAVRVVGFVDAGNVYFDGDKRFGGASSGGGLSSGGGPMRFSSGVELDWRSPIGPLKFSIATPLNEKLGDRKDPYQFTIATAFS